MIVSGNGQRLIKVTNDDIDKDGHYCVPTTVTEIDSYAFCACTSLKTINMPNVVTIRQAAFIVCDQLEIVVGPKVNLIEQLAFNGCRYLKAFVMPSLNSIAHAVFADCRYLNEIVLSENINSVAESAFHYLYLNTIILDTDNEVEIARIIDLLPQAIQGKAIAKKASEEVYRIQKIQLERLLPVAQTNVLYRFFNPHTKPIVAVDVNKENGKIQSIKKDCVTLPCDILKDINHILGEDNRYYQKAKMLILKEPLPQYPSELDAYSQRIEHIIDLCINKAKEFNPDKKETLLSAENLTNKDYEICNSMAHIKI
ncbi:Uncharacterised protein [Legionella beliardensis]|uniref:Leucine-rich repeat domain-containing protein n=1 Tax=Legionella beliardensis TaxID=91822 RepID=A0A378I1Z3_9GAMM|nr:leucine-rich repeat domain-containing protein [Legionella beliardensis]STX29198.1 Uncharacterised protein [Legionella beliardensis]